MLCSTVLPTLRFLGFFPPLAGFALVLGLFGGCGSKSDPVEPPGRSGNVAEQAKGSPVVAPPRDVPTPTDPGERVLIMVDAAAPPGAAPGAAKQETWISAEEARAQGYTLVDLGNEWTPYIFEELHGDNGQPLPNRYRRVFIGLANDQLDGDGVPLEPGSKNYLELFGIFPSLSVIRERFLQDETRTCMDPERKAALDAVKSVAYVSPAQARRNAAKQAKIGKELEQARQRANVETLAALAEVQPTLAPKIKSYESWLADQRATVAAEQRLICEGFLADPAQNPKKNKHVSGMQDESLQSALRRFQQKHMIYDGQFLRPNTMDFLARSTVENDHESFLRAFRERVVAAADVIEDGSTEGKNGPVTYTTASGEKQALRNLADEYTKDAVQQLGLDTPEAALAFFKRHPASDFQRFKAGVKLPPRPEYYAPHMEVSIVVDRGDVWYDPPFDDKNKLHYQPRQRFPSLTLYLDYLGQHIPLTRWRTTIGGWRRDLASNGYEYWRYKGSDTGPRVLRKIVSGPVWIAPETTPIGGLVRGKTVQKRWQTGVNYDELGPGYKSAYGVVAGYFVIPGQGDAPDVDRGIRAHGSSEYLSMYSPTGYSHGCHRLPNHLAIRLYDFLLQHRHTIIKGDAPMDFSRQFLWQDQVYDMRIPSRGFEFQLDPPIAVNVLEGTIKGTLRSPIEEPVPIPGVRYPPPPPDEGEPIEGETTANGRASVDSKGAP
jgi:hypothetical protein